MAVQKMRLIQKVAEPILLKTGASAVVGGDGLKTRTALELATINTRVVAVAATDIAATSFGACWVTGVFRSTAKAAVNLAPGDLVVVETNGGATFDVGIATELASGIVVNTDPATAGLFEMWLVSEFIGTLLVA